MAAQAALALKGPICTGPPPGGQEDDMQQL